MTPGMWTDGGRPSEVPARSWMGPIDRGPVARPTRWRWPEGAGCATGGGDHINAHVPRRFLRVVPCPAHDRVPCSSSRASSAPSWRRSCCVAWARPTASAGPSPRPRSCRWPRWSQLAALDGEPTPPRRYVRTQGRISSEDEFPDENDRPLVFRRQRLQRRDGRAWATLDDDRVAVPFGIEDRQAFLAIDVDSLGDGLVVVPREAVGCRRRPAHDDGAGRRGPGSGCPGPRAHRPAVRHRAGHGRGRARARAIGRADAQRGRRASPHRDLARPRRGDAHPGLRASGQRPGRRGAAGRRCRAASR